MKQLFIGSQLDGIKFGIDSNNTYIHFMHYSNHEPDNIWLNIESRWKLYESNTDAYPNNEEEMEQLTEQEKYMLLFSIRREKVMDIKLGDKSPHLIMVFDSGKILFINGYHEHYECWQAGEGSDFNSLIVAGPQNSISTFKLE